MSDYLSEDLIIEIFTRLPSKSLVRFRSVSKFLCSHIASPSFIRLHTLRSPQKVLIYHQKFNEETGFVEHFSTLHLEDQLALCSTEEYVEGKTAVRFPFTCFQIVGSCNGILCLLTYRSDIALWNPSIRRILKVPACPSFHSYSEPHTFCIGFCYDPIIDDYKIVVITYTYRTGVQDTCVYNIKSGVWCVITFPTIPFKRATTHGCFVNGSLHWIAKQYLNDTDEIGHYYIMTFDVSSHVFGSIELPEPGWEPKMLMIIHGSLALISGKGDKYWIWVRKEYINSHSWHVDLKFEKNQLEGVMGFLQLNTDGDLLISNLQGFHVYNPQKEVQSEVNVPCRRIEIKMYIESLELINQGAMVCYTKREHFPEEIYIRKTSQQKIHVDLRTHCSTKLSNVEETKT
ncbi:F-box/kelch-repeat protein-like protein [Tanacetum coccineum]